MKSTKLSTMQLHFFFLLLIFLLLSICACKSDLLEDVSKNIDSTDQIQAFQSNSIPSGKGKTILGAKLNNPYARTNVEQALFAIEGVAHSLTPTHYYLKVRPENREQIALLDSLDLDWEEQPVDYEIVYQGEYYEDDNLAEGELPWFYTTIPADMIFPAFVPHEVLEEMVITPYYTHLTYKAFELSGNADLFEGVSTTECHFDCLNWPECLEDGVDCEGGLGDCAPGTVGWPCCLPSYALENPDECAEPGDCFPGAPDYPDCLNPDPEYEACGCVIAGGVSHKRPRGKVTVEDTVLDPDAATEGVRNVKVKTKPNRLFSFIWRLDYTDDKGCFDINKSYNSSSIKLKVKFKNAQVQIKALQQSAAVFAYQSRTFTIDGPNYSDLCIKFFRGGDNTIKTRDWQAATVVNAVAEYANWELPLPPAPMNIWIDRNNNGAPIYGVANIPDLCTSIELEGGEILDYAEFVGQFLGDLLGLTANLFNLYSPDIVLKDRANSDRFRSTIYHELAHVSHYIKAGECYWRKVRAHEFFMALATIADPNQNRDPYGDPTNPPTPMPLYVNYPIVALTESWGEHVGVLYTERKYGIVSNNYLQDLENLGIRNNFIPEGLHYDLMDGIDLTDGSNLVDNVEGATLLELYQLLNNETVADYRDDVSSSTSATGDILNLFSQYGY